MSLASRSTLLSLCMFGGAHLVRGDTHVRSLGHWFSWELQWANPMPDLWVFRGSRVWGRGIFLIEDLRILLHSFTLVCVLLRAWLA